MDKARARRRRGEGKGEVEREGRRKACVVDGLLVARRASRRRDEVVAAMTARSIVLVMVQLEGGG